MILTVLGHIWSLPYTVVGVLASALGNARLVSVEKGALIFVARERGIWRWWFDQGWAGITIGNVIIFGNTAQASSPWLVRHELRHCRQYRVFGLLFLPLYGLASAWALLTRRHYYRDNYFELDAKRAERG